MHEGGQSEPLMTLRAWMLASLLLTACVQGPDYSKPAVVVPGAYRFGDRAVDDDASIDRQGWWTQYRDIHLDALIDESLANNRDLRIAAARVDEFSAILAGTRSQGLPQVGYGLSGSRVTSSRGPSHGVSVIVAARARRVPGSHSRWWSADR